MRRGGWRRDGGWTGYCREFVAGEEGLRGVTKGGVCWRSDLMVRRNTVAVWSVGEMALVCGR